MKTKADSKPPRCSHRTQCGRRCLKPVSGPESQFCGRHEAVAGSQPEPDLSATLTAGLEKFNSPAAINDFLSRLLLLLSQNRISVRRAAVLAYIANQILRTIPIMERRGGAQPQAGQTPGNQLLEMIWNLPCPPHERQFQPPVQLAPPEPSPQPQP